MVLEVDAFRGRIGGQQALEPFLSAAVFGEDDDSGVAPLARWPQLAPEPGEKLLRLGIGAGGSDTCPGKQVGQELLFVGQWLPIKGIDYLVAAFAALAESTRARLTCVGTGASADTVLAAFPEAVRPRVRVVPSVDRRGLYDALRAADVFVFPSLSEGFSKALLEAMAAGLPIVATAVGAGVDTLRDGANALVVPPADAGAMATAVGRYLGDVELATRHGAAARATAAHYRLDDVCRQWAERLVAVADRRAFERERMGARRGDAVH